MATKTLTVVRPGRYGTRMLKAGDTFDATAPEARLYAKLGWANEGTPPEAKPVAASTAPAKPKAPRKPPAKKPAAKRAPAEKKAPAKKKTA